MADKKTTRRTRPPDPDAVPDAEPDPAATPDVGTDAVQQLDEPDDDGGATLRIGDRGPRVRELQRALNSAGARVQVDGRYTPSLSRAVARAQRNAELPETGEGDAATLAALGL